MGDGWVIEGERATAVRREGLGSCKGPRLSEEIRYVPMDTGSCCAVRVYKLGRGDVHTHIMGRDRPRTAMCNNVSAERREPGLDPTQSISGVLRKGGLRRVPYIVVRFVC